MQCVPAHAPVRKSVTYNRCGLHQYPAVSRLCSSAGGPLRATGQSLRRKSGRETEGVVPIETTRLTAEPAVSQLPPDGFWLMTLPGGTVALNLGTGLAGVLAGT